MNEAEQQAGGRRDAGVDDGEAELPEPWFIRDLREKRLAASGDRSEQIRPATDELRLDPLRNSLGHAPASATSGAADAGAPGAVQAPWRPVWLYAAAAAVVAIAVLMLWLTAPARVGGADSVDAARTVAPLAATPAVTASAPPTGLCIRPATLDRLRGLLIQDAARAGGNPAGLARAAAGLSLSVAETPDSSGDEGAANCRGWLSLAQSGLATASAPVSFRALPVGGGEARISVLLGAGPIVAALLDAGGTAGMETAGGAAVPDPDDGQEAPQVTVTVPGPANTSPPVVVADVPSPRPPQRYSNPSFDCRRVTSWVNRTICASDALAAQDRAMSTLFYNLADDAGRGLRAELDDSRRDFLSRIQRCNDEDCIASVYDDRIEELRSYR